MIDHEEPPPPLDTLACPECGLENLRTRVVCFRCKASLKPKPPDASQSGARPARKKASPASGPPPVELRLKPEMSRPGDKPRPFGFSSVARDGALPEQADRTHYLDREFQDLQKIAQDDLPEELKQELEAQQRRTAGEREAADERRRRTLIVAFALGVSSLVALGLIQAYFLNPPSLIRYLVVEAALGAVATALLVYREGGRFRGMLLFGGAAVVGVVAGEGGRRFSRAFESADGITASAVLVVTSLLAAGAGLLIGTYLTSFALEK